MPVTAAGVSIASTAGLMVKYLSDPQTKQKWEALAMQRMVHTTEFNELEIGTTYGDAGPKKSDVVPAAPILLQTQLQAGGRKVNIRIENPLFRDDEDIIKAGRYHTQTRMGFEEKLTSDDVVGVVDEHHIGVLEDLVEFGDQNTANLTAGELMKKFTKRITDNDASRMDLGIFYGFFGGYDYHTHINSCIRKGVSNGAAPVADAEGGVLRPLEEHPDTRVYHITSSVSQLEKVVYNTTQATFAANLSTAASKITSAAKPGLDLLYRIRQAIARKKMIPCIYKTTFGETRKFYLVKMSNRLKNLLEQDSDFRATINSAYQGEVHKNPIMVEGDILWKNLIIRGSDRLDQDIFSYKNSFMAVGDATDDVNGASFDIVTGVENGKVGLTQGVNRFKDSTAAVTSLGRTNTELVGRIMVMGANSTMRLVGKKYQFVPTEVTDYNKKQGVGRTIHFGHQLVRAYKSEVSGLVPGDVPQSFQILCFQGD